MDEFSYIGTELEVFNHATQWKEYYASQLRPFLGEEVLEVGAGIGGTTKILCGENQKRWVCLEPDDTLSNQIKERIGSGELPAKCEVTTKTLQQLEPEQKFDSIIYIDVLEHIENDKEETLAAAAHLKKGGYLIILSPAHQWLYTPFDKAIGHFRRYNKKTLNEALPSELKRVRLIYLDSLGLFASLGNKLILHSSKPSYQQIQFWDKKIVPLSRISDRLLGFSAGKSILGVWQKV